MIFPINFEEKVGFDKIRNYLKGNCLSTLGKDKVDKIRFSDSFNEIKTWLGLNHEFVAIIREEESFPLQHFFDLRETLTHLKIEGTFIELQQLFDLKRSLEEIKSIVQFLSKAEEGKYPCLKMLAGDIQLFPNLLTGIDKILNKEGMVRDDASDELFLIRKTLKSKLAGASKIIHNLLQQAKNENIIESDVQLTVRDGKMLIPVPASAKRKIRGYVADESATGKTAFIEPLEMIELNNEIRELEFAERREIVKILTDFSNTLRPQIDDLLASYDFLAEIDFIRAKALFSIKINAGLPSLTHQKGFDILYARHPLLYLSLEKEGRKVVPLDINLSEKKRIILISGPNAGGKSVCLKTVGLLQYMLQCGLLVPMSENSRMGIFRSLFIDIGDQQSIEDDLSTYSSHLKNMKMFVETANEDTLILIDEFGSGTEPALGGAIAEAILESFVDKNSYGIITTHYGNLKHFASSAPNMVNGAMLYDHKNMKPLYELEIGRPGSSFAFEIAGNIGLPEKILKIAEQKVGRQHIDFENNLREIEKERKEFSNLNKSLKQKESNLNALISKYEEETKVTAQRRKDIIRDAKIQAESILAGLNKTIEKSIYDIRKENADKEKTKEIRQNLESLKANIGKRFEQEEKFLSRKIEKIQNQGIRKTKTEKPVKDKNSDEFKIGDKVRLKNGQGTGEILEIKENKFLISLGNMHMFVEKEQLEKISNNQLKMEYRPESKPVQPDILELSKVKNSFTHGIDVRGKRADEALQLISRYIDECVMVEAGEVKILHGKGNGILRQLIREYLKTIHVIKSIKDEKVEFGGAGITVVTFDYHS